jgi:hypothetical protein
MKFPKGMDVACKDTLVFHPQLYQYAQIESYFNLSLFPAHQYEHTLVKVRQFMKKEEIF